MNQVRGSPPIIEYKFGTKEQEIAPCSLFESVVVVLNFRASSLLFIVLLTLNVNVYNRQCFS